MRHGPGRARIREKKEGYQTDKLPLAAIADFAADIWHEDGAVVVADKPRGMAVVPPDAVASDTLINALLGSNRWLADMESSYAPGVIYPINPGDRGLVAVAKNEAAAEQLRRAYRDRQWLFSFRVRLPAGETLVETPLVHVKDRRAYPDGTTLIDIDSPIGDTDELRQRWLERGHAAGSFFCLYRVTIPEPAGNVMVALGERIPLPAIELYSAPP